MLSHISESTGAKPSVGQLVSVIVRLHLNALKNMAEPAASAEVPGQNLRR